MTNPNVHPFTDDELINHILFLMRGDGDLLSGCMHYNAVNESVQHNVIKEITKDGQTIIDRLFRELEAKMKYGGDPQLIIQVLNDYATNNQHTVGVVGFRYEPDRVTTGEVKT